MIEEHIRYAAPEYAAQNGVNSVVSLGEVLVTIGLLNS